MTGATKDGRFASAYFRIVQALRMESEQPGPGPGSAADGGAGKPIKRYRRSDLDEEEERAKLLIEDEQ